MYWNDVFIKIVAENTSHFIGKEYDISPSIQKHFIHTRSINKSLKKIEKKQYMESLKLLLFVIENIRKD